MNYFSLVFFSFFFSSFFSSFCLLSSLCRVCLLFFFLSFFVLVLWRKMLQKLFYNTFAYNQNTLYTHDAYIRNTEKKRFTKEIQQKR